MEVPILISAIFLAAAFDVRWYVIPNVLTYGLFLCGLCLAVLGMGSLTIVEAFVAAGVSFVVLCPLVIAGFLGGGDLKLLVAIATLGGLPFLLLLLVWTLPVAAIILLWSRWDGGKAVFSLKKVLANVFSLFDQKYALDKSEAIMDKNRLPFGLPLAVGVTCMLIQAFVS